jgi:hypothetical protein
VRAVIALGLMMVSTNLEAEEQFDGAWSTLESSSMSKRLDLDFLILSPKLLHGSILISPETELPASFFGSRSSLYVTTKTPYNQWFRLVDRPFAEQDTAQGALEFEFRLVRGAIYLSLGRSD